MGVRGGGQGDKPPPKCQTRKKISYVFSSKFQRKADSDQNDLREESVFLRNFEESGKKLKKNKLGSLPRKIDSSLRTFWSESAFL